MANMEELQPAFLDGSQLQVLQEAEQELNGKAEKAEIYLLALTKERG